MSARTARHSMVGRRLSRPHLTAAALVGVAALALGGAATNAAFTSSVVVEAQVATGTLDINVNGNQGTAASPYVIPLPAGKYEPGTSKTVNLDLRNTGSIDAKVTGSTVVTGTASGLAARLNAKLTQGVTVVFDGKLDKLAVAGLALDGGSSKALTLVISAPADLDNAFQGRADTVTLTLLASQALLS